MDDQTVFYICFGSFLVLSGMAIGVFRFGEGLWSNYILLQNMLFTTMGIFLLAYPIAALGRMIDDMAGVGIPAAFVAPLGWIAYAVTLTILQLISNKFSEVRLKFHPIFEILFNLWAMSAIWGMYICAWIIIWVVSLSA